MSPQRILLLSSAILLVTVVTVAIFSRGTTSRPGSRSATRPDDLRAASAPASTSATRADVLREQPSPPAATERRGDRSRMVDTQIAHPTDGRDAVTNALVLEAMRTVPRHGFVPERYRPLAYADTALPIGYGQTISQPYIVALMTERLRLTPESRVLEIGTGSGYQAAVLAHLTPHVYTIEIVEPLGKEAQRVLREQGYHQVQCRIGDGYKGWPEAAPFDGIIVTCAAEDLPQPLWEQLKPGGRIVIPTGEPGQIQRLVVITKTPDGTRQMQTVTAVQFVPLIREKPP